jgi:hypothetical protein
MKFLRSIAQKFNWLIAGMAITLVATTGGVIGLVQATGGSSSAFVPVSPVRILDTRDPNNVGLNGPFVSQVPQDLIVVGSIATATGIQSIVPAGATGVSLNVTVYNPRADGYISIRPADASGAPTTSNLNFTAGQTVPNAVTVNLPTSGADAGKIEIYFDALGATGPTAEIFIDVLGYYETSGASTPTTTPPTTPTTVGSTIPTDPVATENWNLLSNETYYTGGQNWGSTFDGEYVWVANEGDHSVNRYVAMFDHTDRTSGVGIYIPRSFPGASPHDVAFDGTSIWVTISGGGVDKVAKFNRETFALEATVTLPSGADPKGILWDGKFIYVANYGNDSISRIDALANTPSVVQTLQLTTGDDPINMATDGLSIFVTNFGSNTVEAFARTTMAQTTGHRISVTSQPHGIVFDGHNLWITGFANSAVQPIYLYTRLAGPNISSSGTTRYRGLVFDGQEVWIAYDVPDCGFACASEHSEIAPIDPITNTIVRNRAIYLEFGDMNPVSAVFDGHSIWVADYDGYVTRTYIK